MVIPSTSATSGIMIRPARLLSQPRRRLKRGLRDDLGGFLALFVFPMAAGKGLDRSLIFQGSPLTFASILAIYAGRCKLFGDWARISVRTDLADGYCPVTSCSTRSTTSAGPGIAAISRRK